MSSKREPGVSPSRATRTTLLILGGFTAALLVGSDSYSNERRRRCSNLPDRPRPGNHRNADSRAETSSPPELIPAGKPWMAPLERQKVKGPDLRFCRSGQHFGRATRT